LDKTAKGFAFVRAALIDPAFRAKLAEVHQRLEVRRATDIRLRGAFARSG
jgi:hypothetical protein